MIATASRVGYAFTFLGAHDAQGTLHGMGFLNEYELRPLSLAEPHGLRPLGLALGNGPNALEVAIAESATPPTASNLRAAWKARLGGRATPLLLVALYDGKAALCGPAGDHPPAFVGLDAGKVERICGAALAEPDRHAALRFLHSVVPEVETPLSGVRNEGLFATHELQTGVPRRLEWVEASQKGRECLNLRGQPLIQRLGFTLEPMPGPSFILRAAETRVALAVFLERNEAPEIPNARFSNLSAVSYALAKADAENLDYVMVSAGSAIRLYPVRSGVGVGRRGRTETFVELHLDLLSNEHAGFLWLMFSADALRRGGSVQRILDDSARYAVSLGTRLRDRVYADVVPRLAQAILEARHLTSPSAEDLADTYQMALVVLFRLLFVAYAEDKELLPFKTNDLYKARSLKQKARDLIELLHSKTPFGQDTTHWEEVDRLFRAVDKGNAEWGVPAYNGGLFSRDPAVSRAGATLAAIRVPDSAFGLVLQSLLVDHTPEGWGPVDFRSLGVREFGTIYEGLLENELSIAEVDLTTEVVKKQDQYRPAKPKDEIVVRKGRPYLHNTSGARKATGSYFTKHFAVEHLLEQALEPALKDHLAWLDQLDDRSAADGFFDFRVADIAMGSGHFLTATVDRIERAFSGYLAKRHLPDVFEELARLRQAAREALGPQSEEIDPIEDTQLLRRQIARRCIYGVDLNSISVELARLSLWVHTFVPGLPLSFLDHSLVMGNSLVGIATIQEASDWLTDILEKPLFALSAEPLVGQARQALDRLARLSDANAAEIERAREAFRQARASVKPAEALLDCLVATRISEDVRVEVFHNASHWMEAPATVLDSKAHDLAKEALKAIPPFHFPIAFPEVFLRERSGFDVIVGNPPWEKVRVEEHEFWARHSPGLRGVGKGERDSWVKSLRRKRPDLLALWEQERAASEIVRNAVRFLPGMNTGHPDLFRAFIWRFIQLARHENGRLGVVLPGDAFKIAGCEDLRKRFAAACSTISPQMLTNKRAWVFDDVHQQKLIALVTAAAGREDGETVFRLSPEFHALQSWERRDPDSTVDVPIGWLRSYSPTLVLPLLPCTESFETLQAFMRSPAMAGHPTLRVRRVYADFETAKRDKRYWHSEKAEGDWPVYAGESFDIWEPDTRAYYAFTDAKGIQEAAYVKWNRAPSSSPYAELPRSWRENSRNHPMWFPRIAFRNVTNRTNRRTFVAALIPPQVVTVEVAPWVLWLDPGHSKRDEAFLVACRRDIISTNTTANIGILPANGLSAGRVSIDVAT